MRLFVSTDFEGTAGIVDFAQTLPGPAYEDGRRLLLGEVNAAIEGAVAAGAQHVLVNDAHAHMYNLAPGELAGGASSLQGRHKPRYMMEGLDASFDAAFLVSYHGSVGAERAILSHTYNPAAVHEVRLNGQVVGESGVNALVAAHHGVPVALVTGDEATAAEAEPLFPGAELVVVKRSVGRFAAESLHPTRARERIRQGAERALRRLGELGPPAVRTPARLDVSLLVADMAEVATWARGVERTGPRTVSIEGDDLLALYRSFVAVVALTRGLAD